MNFCKTTGCTFAACALAAALGACGDGLADDVADALLPASPAFAALPPLLDDDGHPSSSLERARPRRGDEITRAGLYALRAQAEALDRALYSDVVWVNPICCGSPDGQPAVDQALGIVAGMMAARSLPRAAPVFVDLPDRRQGAVLADRLAEAGYTRVFLVTD